MTLRLLNCADYLQEIAEQHILDYSAVHVICRLLAGYLAESRLPSQVGEYTQELTSLVSPQSGFGIVEIWTTLSSTIPNESNRMTVLQTAASRLGKKEGGTSSALYRRSYGLCFTDLRMQIFNLMALRTLPSSNIMQHTPDDQLDAILHDIQAVCRCISSEEPITHKHSESAQS